MKFTCPPERVTAIVVGIETYRGGKEWTLNGPALDAFRFARWLVVERKVPAKNVRLFASPAPASTKKADTERKALIKELGAKKLTYEEPTQKAVIEALYGAKPVDNDAALIVFWSGHGAADDRTEARHLFCSDAFDEFGYSVDISDLAQRWRVLPKFSAFREQWLIVDACAQWLSELNVLPQSNAPPFPDARVPDKPDQYVMFATPVGRMARTDAATASSVFTSALLDTLPAAGWPDPSSVWNDLEQKLKDEAQSPIVEWRTPHEGVKFIGPGANAGAHTLVTQLDGVSNGWVQRAFALTVPQSAKLTPPGSYVDAIRRLETLVESKDVGKLTPTQRFLLRLARICRDEKQDAAADAIDAWLAKHVVDKPGLESESKTLARPRPAIATLRLWIPVSDSPREIRAVLDLGGESISWSPPVTAAKTITSVVAAAREFALDAFGKIPSSQRPRHLVFELRLPGKRLPERLDAIELELPDSEGGTTKVPLYARHVALQRVIDRTPTNDHRNDWNNAWKDVSSCVDDGDPFEVQWVEAMGDREFAGHDFRQFPWIGFTFAAAHTDQSRLRPLRQALRSGAPLLLWPSQDLPKNDVDTFKDAIVTRLRGAKLASLVDDLVAHHQARAGSTPASVIVDRPSDATDPPELVQPAQKGTT